MVEERKVMKRERVDYIEKVSVVEVYEYGMWCGRGSAGMKWVG